MPGKEKRPNEPTAEELTAEELDKAQGGTSQLSVGETADSRRVTKVDGFSIKQKIIE